MPSDAAPSNTESAPDASEKGGGKLRLLTLSDLDGRTKARKDADAFLDAIISDLGGDQHVPAGKKALAEHAAILNAMSIHQGAAFLAGQPVNIADYTTTVNALRRLLETVGLERVAKDITPSISQYAARKAAEKAEAAA